MIEILSGVESAGFGSLKIICPLSLRGTHACSDHGFIEENTLNTEVSTTACREAFTVI